MTKQCKNQQRICLTCLMPSAFNITKPDLTDLYPCTIILSLDVVAVLRHTITRSGMPTTVHGEQHQYCVYRMLVLGNSMCINSRQSIQLTFHEHSTAIPWKTVMIRLFRTKAEQKSIQQSNLSHNKSANVSRCSSIALLRLPSLSTHRFRRDNGTRCQLSTRFGITVPCLVKFASVACFSGV